MVSVEDTVKTFLECLMVPMHDKSEEDQKKIQEILKKSAVDLCYAIVPEVDTLVSDRGIFSPESPEKAAVKKAFFKEQRKAFFAMVNAMSILKSQIEKSEYEHKKAVGEIQLELEKMEKRIRSLIKINNTGLSSTRQTPATKVEKSRGI